MMHWYVLYTRPNHERVVADRLFQRGFDAYLPRTAGRRQARRLLFPRHVFVRCSLNPVTHLVLITIPGVQRILEDGQDRFWIIPEDEIRSLQQLSTQGQLSACATALHPRLLPSTHRTA